MRTVFIALPLMFTLQACSTLQETQVSVPEIKLNIDPSTPKVQTKSGVSMTLVNPEVEVKSFVNRALKEPTLAQSLINLPSSGTQIYSVQQVPIYYPAQSSLTFHVKIRNNLDRPLRLNGSIISVEMSDKIVSSINSDLTEPQEFKAASKTLSGSLGIITNPVVSGQSVKSDETWHGLPESVVSEFQRVVILPGKERELDIVAPKHVNIPERTSFVISLMDVVTSLDKASNAIAKESFSWVVNYSRTSMKKTQSMVEETKMLSPFEVAQIRSLNSVN